MEQFTQALIAVSGEVLPITPDQIPHAVQRLVSDDPTPGLCPQLDNSEADLIGNLRRAGIRLLETAWPEPSGSQRLDQANWGIVRARAGLADSGTVVLANQPPGTQVASLLPPTLFVLLSQRDLHANLKAWLASGGKALLQRSAMVSLVTGPSRTSDIEMTMTLGVHGPGKLVVLLLP